MKPKTENQEFLALMERVWVKVGESVELKMEAQQ